MPLISSEGFHSLILFTLIFSGLDGVDTNLFVILLEGGQILTGLGEFTLLHTLSDVPVDEGPLGVHQIELVVQTGPGLGDGGRVAQHAHGTLHLGQISTGDDGWWLVVDANLKTKIHNISYLPWLI